MEWSEILEKAAADENSWAAAVSSIWNMVPHTEAPPNWDTMTPEQTDAYVEKMALR